MDAPGSEHELHAVPSAPTADDPVAPQARDGPDDLDLRDGAGGADAGVLTEVPAPLPRAGGLADVPERAAAPAGDAAAEEDAFCELLGDAYLRTDSHGIVRRLNAAAGALLGSNVRSLEGRPIFGLVAPEHRRALRTVVGGLAGAPPVQSWTLELRPLQAPPVVVDVRVAPVHDAAGRVRGARWLLRPVAGAVAEAAPAPIVAAAPPPMVTSGYFAELLARISMVLGDSLDVRAMLAAVARSVVPGLADWCLVDVVNGEGRLERLAVAGAATEAPALREQLAAAPAPRSDEPPAVAVRTRRTRLATSPAPSDAGAPRPSAWLAVPLVARGQVIGALSCVMVGSRRGFAPVALGVAEELARRVALSVDNARLYREALRASEAKSNFLATISHELRTPLTAVIGYAELLADGLAGPLEGRQVDFVQRIRESGDHLLHLVEEVLGFARLEAGEERLTVERLELCAVTRQVVRLLTPLAERKGLALRFEAGAGPLWMDGDATKLRQILVNLVGNALKFTDRGEVVVRLAAVDAPDAAPRVELTVADTGIGIAPEALAHVFDPFWQVEQSPTRGHGGTGLGLSVVRQLARLLGGDVTAESAPGQGSRFVVSLPRQQLGRPPVVPAEAGAA